jgi:hypothetical protein
MKKVINNKMKMKKFSFIKYIFFIPPNNRGISTKAEDRYCKITPKNSIIKI